MSRRVGAEGVMMVVGMRKATQAKSAMTAACGCEVVCASHNLRLPFLFLSMKHV